MNVRLEKNVLVDTCFLISLVNASDALHGNAEEYFRHFIESHTTLFISTIALAEFQQKQDLEILENFRVLPFGLDEVAALNKHFSRGDVAGRPSELRITRKDDMKIISTCLAHNIDSVISSNDDFNTLAKNRNIRVIDYREPLSKYLGTLPL